MYIYIPGLHLAFQRLGGSSDIMGWHAMNYVKGMECGFLEHELGIEGLDIMEGEFSFVILCIKFRG